jgi:hypothetical protein
MQIPGRFIGAVSAVLFLMCAVPSGFAQNAPVGALTPMHVKKQAVEVKTVRSFSRDMVLTQKPTRNSGETYVPFAHGPIGNASTSTGTGGNISGLQTLPTFVGAFAPEAGPSLGNIYPFVMIGNDPLVSGTTTIPVDMTEVTLQLLNGDGTTFATVPYAPFSTITTHSPNFENAVYDSSIPATQFGDGVQRAEFFNTAKSGWHTKLKTPAIVNQVTIAVPKTVQVQLSNGTIITATAYFTGTAPDGSTFVLMLDLLFNSFFDSQVVNDINAGNFPTDAINYELFPNTFLFSLDTSNPTVPGACCVLGFHTYFYEGGVTPQPRWVTIFASYVSAGLFGGGFQDVTGLSHETAESLNDPFLNNATPVWQFPGQPANSTVCQGNLETGDPVEVTANAVFPVTLKVSGKPFTFHPQTEALLQWFEMGTTSNAVDGAFSYPDETALTASAVPCP